MLANNHDRSTQPIVTSSLVKWNLAGSSGPYFRSFSRSRAATPGSQHVLTPPPPFSALAHRSAPCWPCQAPSMFSQNLVFSNREAEVIVRKLQVCSCGAALMRCAWKAFPVLSVTSNTAKTQLKRLQSRQLRADGGNRREFQLHLEHLIACLSADLHFGGLSHVLHLQSVHFDLYQFIFASLIFIRSLHLNRLYLI